MDKLQQLLQGGVGCKSDVKPARRIRGDVLRALRDSEIDVCLAEANCFGEPERGFSTALISKYPSLSALIKDKKVGDGKLLGKVINETVDEGTICLLYTRYHKFGNKRRDGVTKPKRRFSGDAFRKALRSALKKNAGKRIGMPLFGIDRCGAPRDEVFGIIDEVCVEMEANLTVYLPKERS